MPLNANATMIFQNRADGGLPYDVVDGGVNLYFHCPDPGPGMPSEWMVFCTDAEIAALTNLASAQTLVVNKLTRKFRRTATAAKLDQLVGRSVILP